MILNQLVNKSAYGTIGYVGSENDLIKIDKYFAHNREVINQYAHIIIATNFDSEELIAIHTLLCKHHFPNCILLNSINNRGHNFGTADLDNLLFNYCKENNIEWLCKSANDIIIHNELLSKGIGESDFYYFMSIGYGWLLEKYNLDLDKFINDDYFYPQTNFYFINVSKTDYLNDAHYIDETYNYTKSLNNYNGRVWEYIENWSCEKFLKDCVERNNLKKEHLLNDSTYISLLNFIKDNRYQDPSHKNIMMENICHLHFPEQNIIYI
jgi:hypothetical protein